MTDPAMLIGGLIVGYVTIATVGWYHASRSLGEKLAAERSLRCQLTIEVTRLECKLVKAGVLELSHRRAGDGEFRDCGWAIASKELVTTLASLQKRGCIVLPKDDNSSPRGER